MFISSKKDTFTETSSIVFDQISGYCGAAKFTHKISHHVTPDKVIIPEKVTVVLHHIELSRQTGWI